MVRHVSNSPKPSYNYSVNSRVHFIDNHLAHISTPRCAIPRLPQQPTRRERESTRIWGIGMARCIVSRYVRGSSETRGGVVSTGRLDRMVTDKARAGRVAHASLNSDAVYVLSGPSLSIALAPSVVIYAVWAKCH